MATVDLEDAVKKALEQYGADVSEIMAEIIPEVAKESVKKLRKNSPKRKGKNGGGYAKGWAVQIDKKRLTIGAVAYNKKKPGLTHLLEKGHAKRGGGRVPPVPESQRIAPVNDWATEEVLKRVTEALERGT